MAFSHCFNSLCSFTIPDKPVARLAPVLLGSSLAPQLAFLTSSSLSPEPTSPANLPLAPKSASPAGPPLAFMLELTLGPAFVDSVSLSPLASGLNPATTISYIKMGLQRLLRICIGAQTPSSNEPYKSFP